MKKKSKPIYNKIKEGSVDSSAGTIKGIVILQSGVDKYGDNFDRKSLDQLVVLGNEQSQGLKSRFGHPNMCDSTLGSYLGRYKNFRIEQNSEGKEVVVADLAIDDVASRSPKGNLKSYVLEMAVKNDDMFGNSIVYMPDTPEAFNEKDEEGNNQIVYYERFKSFLASDLVDSPAATESLFKGKDSSDFAAVVTEFLDSNPEVYDIISKDETVLNSFLTKYKNFKSQKDMTIKKEGSFLNKLKELVDGALNTDKKKDFNMTTTDGKVITCVDPDGDGKPAVGDQINDDQGNPIKDATLNVNDGNTIVTDSDGKITSIAPTEQKEKPAAPAPAPAPAPAAQKSAEERLAALEAELAEEKRLRKEENDAAMKEAKRLTDRIAEVKSTGDPKTSSSTQFKNNRPGEMSKADYKREMEERKNLGKKEPAKV